MRRREPDGFWNLTTKDTKHTKGSERSRPEGVRTVRVVFVYLVVFAVPESHGFAGTRIWNSGMRVKTRVPSSTSTPWKAPCAEASPAPM